MSSRIFRTTLLIVIAVFVFGLVSWGQCSDANVTGKYGYLVYGFDSSGNPIASLGYMKANGKGTFSGTESVADDGEVEQNISVSGTYSINSDCTGSGTIKLKGGKKSNTFALVVVSGGKTLQILSTDTGSVQGGEAEAQGKETCTAAGLKASLGLQASGEFIGTGAVAIDGLATFDGKGDVSGTFSGSLAGEIFTGQSVSGSYTVASNCTGTTSFSLLGQTLTTDFVMTDGAQHLLVLETNTGTVVSGRGEQ